MAPDAIRQVARRARIELSEAEVALLGRQLPVILGWFRQLEGVDTEGVAPAACAIAPGEHPPHPRERLILPPGAALAGAPDAAGGFFRVPKVIP